jgi:hypothetical protein
LLGANSITSLEDDAPEAKFMKVFYMIARDAVLEEAEWTFASKYFTPARLEAVPDWGWSFAYPIPSDILRITRVDRNYLGGIIGQYSDDMARRPAAHEVVSGNIHCNENAIFCKGIRRMDDEGKYSPLFVLAFAAKLAFMAALPLTESNAKQDRMAALYISEISKAKSRDGMQNTTRRMRNTTLGRSRY